MNVVSSVINYIRGYNQEAAPSLLIEMPPEIALRIWNQLENKDIVALNQTCRSFREIRSDDPSLPGYKLRGKLKGQLCDIISKQWYAQAIIAGPQSSGISQLMQYATFSIKEIQVPRSTLVRDIRLESSVTKKVLYKEHKLIFSLEDGVDSAKGKDTPSLQLEMVLSDCKKVEKKNFLRQRYVDDSCDTVYYIEKMTLQEIGKILPQDVRTMLPELQAFVDKIVAELVQAVQKQTMTENRIL